MTDPRPGHLVATDIRVAFPGADRDAPETVALDGMSLDVAPGEIVALIGPNGSGKSTFLRVAAGLLAPSRGTVAIDGDRITEPDPRIGLVFQEPRLLPWRSVADNIAWPMELAGMPERERRARIATLAGQVGLTEAIDLRPVQLSGGMRQRAAIARTLALQPALLLLDEPFSALDALTRERFNDELLALHAASGTTVVVVTHSVPEAMYLADRVVVLTGRPGRVAAQVPTASPRTHDLSVSDRGRIADVEAEIRRHLATSAVAA